MTRVATTEICVIGGGPAGSVVASRLAQLGHKTILVERSVFPRPRVGEAMAPSIWNLLDVLDVRDEIVRAGFVRVEQSILRWRAGAEENVSQPSNRSGLVVDRGRFDAILIEKAKKAGVHVLQPARARRPRLHEDRWIVQVESGKGELLIEARFLVDAAGRFSNIRPTELAPEPLTVAVSGHWRDTPLAPGANRIEAGKTCWYWGAPRPDGAFCAMVFVDPAQCRGRRREIEADYRRRLSDSMLLRDCLRGVLEGGVRLHEASPHQSAVCVTGNSIKVGEASFSLDPLSSQGVQSAISSALQAAVVVHTITTRPEDAEQAKAFYRNARKDAINRHGAAAARHYAAALGNAPTSFWRERAAGAEDSAPPRLNGPSLIFFGRAGLSRDVHVEDVPVIERDHVTSRKGLHHPSLGRPFAYLDGIAVETLLEHVANSDTLETLRSKLARDTDRERGQRMVKWLVEQRILVSSE